MKKGYFKFLALALLVLMGTVACTQSPNSNLSSDSPSAGTEVSGSGTVEGKPSSTPTSPDAGADAAPALPTPPTPLDPAARLELSHKNYADYLKLDGVDATFIRKKWEEHMEPVAPEKVIKNIVYINNFFSFIFEVDGTTRLAIGLAKMDINGAQEFLADNDFEKFNGRLKDAVEVNSEIRKRIAKAAQIYGVDLSETPLATSDQAQDLIQHIQGPVIDKIKGSSGYFKDSVYWSKIISDSKVHLDQLFKSVSFAWNKEGEGTSGFVSFENFRKEPTSLLIYAFDEDQDGGFGAVDAGLIGL